MRIKAREYYMHKTVGLSLLSHYHKINLYLFIACIILKIALIELPDLPLLQYCIGTFK